MDGFSHTGTNLLIIGRNARHFARQPLNFIDTLVDWSSPVKRSFTALDAQEALHIAIYIEERNAELYHRYAEMFAEFGDPESLEVASVFWDMAVEERQHSALLRGKYAEQYGDSKCSLSEEDLLEFIEVPRLEDGDFFGGKEVGVNARDRALQVTLKAEISAQAFYADLAKNTVAGPLCDIYRDLAEMEDGHVGYLKRKLADSAANQRIH